MIYEKIAYGSTLEEIEQLDDFKSLPEAEREAIVEFYQNVPIGVNIKYLDLDVIDKSGKTLKSVRMEI